MAEILRSSRGLRGVNILIKTSSGKRWKPDGGKSSEGFILELTKLPFVETLGRVLKISWSSNSLFREVSGELQC